ncbi:hypothetical protein EYF80_040265 [Liparis tanakae]|uniref:Uncharacterized protein n=1 Tax=Liparis tanakae TaxID=230148 RepID=A0A4Z2G9M4_9TELE|nr:hypothetical protein EYF80_040265 [Liparis tanakae]
MAEEPGCDTACSHKGNKHSGSLPHQKWLQGGITTYLLLRSKYVRKTTTLPTVMPEVAERVVAKASLTFRSCFREAFLLSFSSFFVLQNHFKSSCGSSLHLQSFLKTI